MISLVPNIEAETLYKTEKGEMNVARAAWLVFVLPICVCAVTKNSTDTKCIAGKSGKTVIITDTEGNERVLICLKSDGKYNWRVYDDHPTLGEFFNPAESCLDIVQRRRGAKTGLYWIKRHNWRNNKQAWCDVTTDKGGFMLVGKKNTTVTWTVPSNPETVTPDGPTHWSSDFGNSSMIEFRVQVSPTSKPSDSKADWLYHFTSPRRLTELLVSEKGSGCKNHYPGIGHVEFVKDLLVGKVVARKFHCSRFGPAYQPGLGWQKMNSCLEKPCKLGFAIIPGLNLLYDKYGGFSFSTRYRRSGIQHNSTGFVGCDDGQCCFCYGPKGGTGDYCSPGCKAINGGTVTKSAHVWFWVRSSIPPSPVWTKCAEFKMENQNGVRETYFIHQTTGIVQKGTCSKKNLPKLIDGILDVENKQELQTLPQVKGLLSYRNDNQKLYVANGNGWDALGREIVEKNISRQLSEEKTNLLSELNQLRMKFKNETEFLKNELNQLKVEFENGRQVLKNAFKIIKGKTCLDIKTHSPLARSGVYWIKPDSGSLHFQVYCDMETHSGGWTLVYSYTFTNYNSFGSASNAVTPRPNWYAPIANVPISTTPPLSETSRGAIDYSLWKYIGNDVLIKSNINDWIVCRPNGGSLVTKKDGSMSCHNIKHVAPKCHNPPSKIFWLPPGPSFNKYFYLFDGETDRWCPTHDFCSSCTDHKKGVTNPGGAIYIR